MVSLENRTMCSADLSLFGRSAAVRSPRGKGPREAAVCATDIGLPPRLFASLRRIVLANVRGRRPRSRWRRYTGNPHHLMNRGDGLGGRFEISHAVTLGDFQRCPAVFVLVIPNFDFGALVG